VSGGEARALEQRLSPRARGALVVPDQLRVDAYLLTLALARAAERHGATIRYAEVTGLVRDGERVRGVRLRNGLMHADRVVLAGGPWTGRMAAWTGRSLPITPLRGQLLRLKAGGPAMRTCLMYGKGYLVDKGDGLVLAGTTEERAGFRVRPTRTGRASVITEVLRLAPSLRDAAVVEQTACLRPLSADLLPLLGPVPGSAGLFVAAGHGRQGILLGPISGRLTAELVLGKPPSLAIEAFDPARFRA
jgi:glycine oxidase